MGAGLGALSLVRVMVMAGELTPAMCHRRIWCPEMEREFEMDKTQLIMVVFSADGWYPAIGDVSVLAELLRNSEAGDYVVERAYTLYGVTGQLVPVRWEYKLGEFNEDQFAVATVTVRLPGGDTETSSFRVDGAV